MSDNADVPDAARRPWQGREEDASGAPRSKRPVGLFLLVGLLLTLVSFAIVWILLLRPPAASPYFVTITIGDYNSRHYAGLPFAAHDSELLLRHFPADAKKQAVTKSKKLLREQLKTLDSLAKQPLIVHLAALALVREGNVFVLPGDADPDDEETWLDVREVLDAVKDSPAPQKLLILDIVHPLADARLGLLSDRVAKTLDEKLRKTPPPFHVLIPCASNQFGNGSAALQASALAYYLDLGLQGHADANKTGSITMNEWIDYARPRVDRWARQNLGVRQEPRLYGAGSDFTIVHVNDKTPGPLAPPKLAAYPEDLKKAWKSRDEAWSAGAFRRAPRQLLKLEASLLRQDVRWQRGGMPIKLFDDETRNFEKDLASAMIVQRPAYRSLALAGVAANPALIDALYQTLIQDADPKKSADEHAKKVTDELAKKVKEDKKLEYPQQAAALLEAFGRVKLVDPMHAQATYTALANLRARPYHSEVLLAQRLAVFAKEQYPDDWHRDKIRLLWQTMHAQQMVLASLEREPEFLRLIPPVLDNAEQARRGGERQLFRERPSTWADAVKKLTAAKQSYEQIEKSLELLLKSRVQMDRAFALLPWYAEHLCVWPEDDLPAERAWFDAAEQIHVLQRAFNLAHDEGKPPADTSVAAAKLKERLDELEEAFDLRIRAAEKESGAKANRQLMALLASPLLKAEKRAELADKQRRLTLKLQEQAAALDQEDNDAGRTPRPGDLPAAGNERDAGELRAKMSVAFVRIARPVADKALDLQLDAHWTERELQNAESALRLVWGKLLLERWRSDKPSPAADHLNRLISPWDWHSRVTATDRDSSLLWQKDLRRSYLSWLASSYDAEAKFLEGNKYDRPYAEFYTDAAEKLRLSISASD